MKVYIQTVTGEEFELEVREPDPKDGTWVAFDERHPNEWIRIVPDDE
jgi:hypothetical protein